jgi:hypothetical protein
MFLVIQIVVIFSNMYFNLQDIYEVNKSLGVIYELISFRCFILYVEANKICGPAILQTFCPILRIVFSGTDSDSIELVAFNLRHLYSRICSW